MLNLTPHRRLKIPDGLAILAAVLLIGSSVVGVSSNENTLATVDECDITLTVKNIESDFKVIDDAVKHKSHVLKLGLQLFRR